MQPQIREYLCWAGARHLAVAVLFYFDSGKVRSGPSTQYLFQYLPPAGWIVMSMIVGSACVVSAFNKNGYAYRYSLSLSTAVTLLFGLLLLWGGFDNKSATPFIAIFLLALAGKDFAIARLPVVNLVKRRAP